jgi:alpha-L-glutamate ligase-like protein
VDDKLLTKTLCETEKLPVPETYCAVKNFGQIGEIKDKLDKLNDFVIKPSSGAGGRGVLVITGKKDQYYVKSDDTELAFADIRYHISTIISGLYSLGGQPDTAIIETRIKPHPVFKDIAVEGTPDIRVIVYRGIPTLAMLRLPTALSKGRANLHQGAIAAGIAMSSGITRGGVWKNRAINFHPETGVSIIGVEVPFWEVIIETSIKLFDILELNYFGVDFVLDIDKGPVLLEANARPGLAIQIANRIGLAKRLEFIDQFAPPIMTKSEKLAFVSRVSAVE